MFETFFCKFDSFRYFCIKLILLQKVTLKICDLRQKMNPRGRRGNFQYVGQGTTQKFSAIKHGFISSNLPGLVSLFWSEVFSRGRKQRQEEMVLLVCQLGHASLTLYVKTLPF